MNEEKTINDLLGLPVFIGDTILGISGPERVIDIVEDIDIQSILTKEGNTYFIGNFIKIDDIIEQNAEYFT